jgi:hypothetical protein
MVSPLSLYIFAALLWAAAVAVRWLRERGLRGSMPEARVAVGGAAIILLLAIVLFTVGNRTGASENWVVAARWALLASPLGAALALRRHGRAGAPRTLLGGALGTTGVILWLTLDLRGPRGGWSAAQVVLVALGAALAVGGGACLGRWSKRGVWRRDLAGALALMLALAAAGACRPGGEAAEPAGGLELTIVDAATGRPTPARVELLDAAGNEVIPDGALSIFADCGNLPVHGWVPGWAGLQAVAKGRRDISNPYTGTRQFYAEDTMAAQLPAGLYTVRAAKGPEYLEASDTIRVEAGQETRATLGLRRWIDLPSEGWYGADDHLHIPRPDPSFDPQLAAWMEAEGLNVANLLQMGLARDVHITPQRGFGQRSVYQRGDTLILSGQENPRTHILGHAIVLGAQRFIDLPQDYLLYDRVWQEARRQGAVNGYAHWGLGGAEEGLALWGETGLLDFLEVLNLGFPFYDRWYEALDLGFRLGPTAGTDYPCLPGLPGRERFYARLEGELTAESWLEAVRRGATFVTNGPAIDLTVDGALPGDEVRLAAPGEVAVHGRVRFDPERDAVETLELVRSGEVVRRVEATEGQGVIRLDTSVTIDRTSWLALRSVGVRRGESPIDLRAMFTTMLVLDRPSNDALLASLPAGPVPRASAAHSGAIFVTVAGTPPLAEQARGREVARIWLDRLRTLERRFEPDQIESWARFPGRGDGIDRATALANRAAMLEAIQAAARYYGAVETRPAE